MTSRVRALLAAAAVALLVTLAGCSDSPKQPYPALTPPAMRTSDVATLAARLDCHDIRGLTQLPFAASVSRCDLAYPPSASDGDATVCLIMFASREGQRRYGDSPAAGEGGPELWGDRWIITCVSEPGLIVLRGRLREGTIR